MISLDDPKAARADLVGGKAASLAQARQRGFAVLDGFIVPASEATDALEAGARGYLKRREVGAWSAVARCEVTVDRRPLAEWLPSDPTLVARSSTNRDGDGRFAGAFATYGELSVEDLETAIRGCWSSVFSRQAVNRLKLAGFGFRDIEMSVLIQVEVNPSMGGYARLNDGDIEVAWTTGHPQALLTGHVTGLRWRPQSHVYAPSEVVEAARLMQSAADDLGAASIEWATDSSGLWLLQVNTLQVVRGLSPPFREVTLSVGTPSSSGAATGPLIRIESPDDIARVVPGSIVLIQQPLIAYAPVLWVAGALLTLEGSSAAHICDVARALRVPMVVGVSIEDDATFVAVDADTGEVSRVS